LSRERRSRGAEEQRSRGASGRRIQFSDTLGVFPYISFFRTTTSYMGVDKMHYLLTCHHWAKGHRQQVTGEPDLWFLLDFTGKN